MINDFGRCMWKSGSFCRTSVKLTSAFAVNPGMEWAYWAVAPGVECVFRPTGDGVYEVFILVSSRIISTLKGC